MKYFIVMVCGLCACCGWAVGELRFSVDDTKLMHDDVPKIVPWRTVTLDPDYGGQWVIAGDLDKDGVPEIIAAENHNEGDVHYTSAVVAQNLKGEVLWQWGKPDIGRKKWHHDVACQMHDWDGNGQVDVIVCDEGALVEIDGCIGAEKRRIEIDKEATDCVSFCDLSGEGRPTDVLVKNRYDQIWAYDKNGTLLWTVNHPGGYRTAHQVRAIDLDGDGRDELMAGYACLNHDGSVRWVYESENIDLKRGHLDCAFQDAQRAVRLVRQNAAAWHLDPNRIGVMGFSAGGHLSARASTGFKETSYDAVDEADKLSCRPDFCILIYPAYLDNEKQDGVAPELHITKDVPPTFIVHTLDDKRFITGSKLYAQALKDAGVPCDYQIFETGGHGYGLRSQGHPVSVWPKRCEEWLKSIEIIR